MGLNELIFFDDSFWYFNYFMGSGNGRSSDQR